MSHPTLRNRILALYPSIPRRALWDICESRPQTSADRAVIDYLYRTQPNNLMVNRLAQEWQAPKVGASGT